MIYELRNWFDGNACLYTDDQRVKDLAIGTAGLSISARYFSSAKASHPFAWDIVGRRAALERMTSGFRRRGVKTKSLNR